MTGSVLKLTIAGIILSGGPVSSFSTDSEGISLLNVHVSSTLYTKKARLMWTGPNSLN